MNHSNKSIVEAELYSRIILGEKLLKAARESIKSQDYWNAAASINECSELQIDSFLMTKAGDVCSAARYIKDRNESRTN